MRVAWDSPENRAWTSGITQGVLYPENSPGVAWNGLAGIAENGTPEQDPGYYDGKRYRVRGIPGVFSGTISAFTYPDELEPFISTLYGHRVQHRVLPGISYRNNREIHLVYNVLLARKERSYSSLSEEDEPVSLEWVFTTLPVKIPGGKSSSHIVIMVDKSDPEALSELEVMLYGDEENDPFLPSAEDIYNLFESHAMLRITDNGDGTWTADGPDTIITNPVSDRIRGWCYQEDGQAYNSHYFVLTTARADTIDVGDLFQIWKGGTLWDGVLRRVTGKEPPYAGYTQVDFTPDAPTWLSGDEVIIQAGWSYQEDGQVYNSHCFNVTNARADNIKIGDQFRLWVNGELWDDVLRTVTGKDPPFAGYTHVNFSPDAPTWLSGDETITQAEINLTRFRIDWPSVIFTGDDSFIIRSL